MSVTAVLSRDPAPGSNRFLCDTRAGEREWVELPPNHEMRKQFERARFPPIENMQAWANGIEIIDSTHDD